MKLLVVTFCLVLCAAASFAGTVVFPNANAATEGSSNSAAPFGGGGFAEEYLMAGSQFAAIPVGAQITGVGYRLDGGSVNGPSADIVYSDFTIQLSTSLVAMGSLTNVFANNIGADVVTVRSGALTVPQNAFTGGAGPNPFFFVNFTTPYTYKGGDLLFTLNFAAVGPGIDIDAIHVGPILDTAVAGGNVHFFDGPVLAFNFQTASVPEPSSVALFALGGAALLFKRLRSRAR